MSVEEEVEHPKGTRRPLIPKQMDIRVGQYAEKNDLSKKEAYTEIIDFVIDGEGRVKRENVIKE